MQDKPDRMNGTVSLPSMSEGNVGLCVATQIARYVKPGNPLPGWKSPYQAWAMTQGQLAWYKSMEEAGEMVQITDREQLEKHLCNGKILTENPGWIYTEPGGSGFHYYTQHILKELTCSGLRAIGPAHYGPGTYAQGTDAAGGIGIKGVEAIKEMER